MSVLWDRDIRSALQAGKVRIDPYDPSCLQPSSVDLQFDADFRVFRNNRYPYVDVRAPQPDLTELSNVANLPIALYRVMKIGQISFFKMSSPVERPYGSKELGSKYQGQSTPTASESYRDFDDDRRPIKGGPRRS